MTFKEFILSAIKWVANALMIVSTLGLIASFALMAINQAIDSGMMVELAENPFFQWLTLERIGTASAYLGAIVAVGGVAKITGSTLKMVVSNSKSELDKQAIVYEEKINKLKEESIDATIEMSKAINKLSDAQRESIRTNNQILESLLVTAHRNINSNLVSLEDKKLYRKFIQDVSGKKEPKLDNIYMTITEKNNEEKEKAEDDDKDFLSMVKEKAKHED